MTVSVWYLVGAFAVLCVAASAVLTLLFRCSSVSQRVAELQEDRHRDVSSGEIFKLRAECDSLRTRLRNDEHRRTLAVQMLSASATELEDVRERMKERSE